MTRSWPALESRICLAAKQQCGYKQALNVFKFSLSCRRQQGQANISST